MILQFLLNYFLTEYQGGKLKPIYELLEKNSFDLSKTLKDAKIETFAPLISSFMSSMSSNSSSPPTNEEHFVVPIQNFADKEILDTLNQYFSN